MQAGALVGSETLLYFIFSDQIILGVARTVIQTVKGTSAGKENAPILLDMFNNENEVAIGPVTGHVPQSYRSGNYVN